MDTTMVQMKLDKKRSKLGSDWREVKCKGKRGSDQRKRSRERGIRG